MALRRVSSFLTYFTNPFAVPTARSPVHEPINNITRGEQSCPTDMEIPYDFEGYVYERGKILLQHQNHARLGEAIWHSVRPTAALVFDNDLTLTLTSSAVHAKELAAGITPLTRLPQRFSTTQVSPESSGRQKHSPLQVDSEAAAPRATSQPRAAQSPATESLFEQHPGGRAVPTPRSSQTRYDSPAAKLQSGQETPSKPSFPHNVTRTSTNGLAELSSDQQSDPGQGVDKPIPSMIDTPQSIAATPAQGVSALAGHAMDVPIKRSSRHRASVNYEDKGEEAEDEPEELPPCKKSKRAAVKGTAKATIKRTKKIPEPAVKQTARPARAIATRVPRNRPQPAEPIKIPPLIRLDPNFELVIGGDALPNTRDLAVWAASERKRRLIEAHMATPAFKKEKAAAQKAAKSKRKGDKKAVELAEYVPDLMPEFFETSNFAKKTDTVRCACGVITDEDDGTGGIWVQCDNKACGVWQHSDCMGDAVPAKIKKDPYFCHNCDPYGHRVLIQDLRKGRKLGQSA